MIVGYWRVGWNFVLLTFRLTRICLRVFNVPHEPKGKERKFLEHTACTSRVWYSVWCERPRGTNHRNSKGNIWTEMISSVGFPPVFGILCFIVFLCVFYILYKTNICTYCKNKMVIKLRSLNFFVNVYFFNKINKNQTKKGSWRIVITSWNVLYLECIVDMLCYFWLFIYKVKKK